jgi:hypothetical protein
MATTHYHSPDDVPSVVSPPVRSTVSVLAICAAIGSIILASKGREFLGMFAAVFAVGAGMIGGVRALSPRVTGGMLSMIAVLLGAIGFIFSVIALFF